MPIATPTTTSVPDAEVAVADLNIYLADPTSEAALAECRKVAESLIVCFAYLPSTLPLIAFC